MSERVFWALLFSVALGIFVAWMWQITDRRILERRRRRSREERKAPPMPAVESLPDEVVSPEPPVTPPAPIEDLRRQADEANEKLDAARRNKDQQALCEHPLWIEMDWSTRHFLLALSKEAILLRNMYLRQSVDEERARYLDCQKRKGSMPDLEELIDELHRRYPTRTVSVSRTLEWSIGKNKRDRNRLTINISDEGDRRLGSNDYYYLTTDDDPKQVLEGVDKWETERPKRFDVNAACIALCDTPVFITERIRGMLKRTGVHMDCSACVQAAITGTNVLAHTCPDDVRRVLL